jgi:PTS system glucitol/sorbitol-specific IIA component
LETIYLTEVKELGPEVAEFLEAGLLILFETGAPPELAEIAVLHDPTARREKAPEPGDVLDIEGQEFRITAVGYKAWQNVQELGHAVFKFDGSPEAELPGQIHLEGPGVENLGEIVQPGARLEIRAGAGSAAAVDREGDVSEP